MRFSSVNERFIDADAHVMAGAMAQLGSEQDVLWPAGMWPRMRLDNGLEVGSSGGHGPVRYAVEAYEPGRVVSFRFDPSNAFGGAHWFELLPMNQGTTLRHVVRGEGSLKSWLGWTLVFGPLHEALIQDALYRAAVHAGAPAERQRWSPYVRLMRWLFKPRRRDRSEENGTRPQSM